MSTIFSENGVNVSAALVQVGGQTYSTPNITSVRVEHPSGLAQAVVSLFFGLLAVFTLRNEGYFLGVVWLGLAAVPWMLQRSKLIIATAGSERRALVANPKLCNRICAAIVTAMQEAATVKRA